MHDPFMNSDSDGTATQGTFAVVSLYVIRKYLTAILKEHF